MNLPQCFTILAGFFAVAMLSGCTRGTNLNVVNRSTAELTNVVATGSGFTQSIGSIPAGEQRNVSVSPRSESALQVDFDVKGKHFTSGRQGYFESGSNAKVTATVSPDFTVVVGTKWTDYVKIPNSCHLVGEASQNENRVEWSPPAQNNPSFADLGALDAALVFTYLRDSAPCVLVAGVNREVAEHAANLLRSVGAEVTVEASSLDVPTVLRPQADRRYRWHWLHGPISV